MKKNLILLVVFLIDCLSVFSQQEIRVISCKLNTTDISVRTNKRDDPTGKPCALVKVQFPKRGAQFLGDIIGSVAFKTNEYWVYMPQSSNQLEIRLEGFKPLVVKFNELETGILESNQSTYELCLLAKEKDAPQLYDDGMVALAHKDLAKAFDYLTKAANSGYGPALYVMGNESVNAFDSNYDSDPNDKDAYQDAFNYYREGAEKGSPEAQYALAKMLLEYREGKSFEKKYGDPWNTNITKITVDEKLLADNYIWSLLESAANAGNVDAQFRMILNDKWCKENAAKGIAIAEFGMGLRSDKELFTEEYSMLESIEINRYEDLKSAYSWYQKAANHGLDVAQWRLGEMYARGMGVESNIDKAIEWRTKAAEQGNYLFQFMMGIMYIYGSFSDYCTYLFSDCYNFRVNLSKDIDKANYWMQILNHKELSKTERERIEVNGVYSASIDELASLLISTDQYSKAIYWYQREIEMGYRDAYCNLGKIYLEGKGVSKDYQKARTLFEKAILDDEHYGDGYSGQLKPEALCYLGVIYRDGLGVKTDRTKALDYLMQSTNYGAYGLYGPALSYYELGNLYYADANYDEALKSYKEAKSNSFDKEQDGKYVWLNEYGTKACYKLGQMYNEGLGCEKNTKMAVEYMKEAATRGSDEAKSYLQKMSTVEVVEKMLDSPQYYYDLGRTAFDSKDYSQAAEWYRKAAEQGHTSAQCSLGYLYEHGFGLSKDLQEAIKWYKLSAEQGDRAGQYNLASCYQRGNGVSINYSEALKWFTLAANQGSREAQNQIAFMYYKGLGVTKSDAEAVKWFTKAAEQGLSDAQYSLGQFYEYGVGVTMNYEQALKWYNLAAKQGDQDAIKAINGIKAKMR